MLPATEWGSPGRRALCLFATLTTSIRTGAQCKVCAAMILTVPLSHSRNIVTRIEVQQQQNAVIFITKPLKRQTKIAADDTLIFYFYLLKKIRLDFRVNSPETSCLIFSVKQ